MNQQTAVVTFPPRLRAFGSADVAAPRDAGIVNCLARRASSLLFKRYAHLHADVLVAGTNYWTNYLVGALARRAGLSVALYYHTDGHANVGSELSDRNGLLDLEPALLKRLADVLDIDIGADAVGLEQLLGTFYSDIGGHLDVESPSAVNIVGSHLVPDGGASTGLPGGEVFWPVPPLHQASVESDQIVAALLMPAVPAVRFEQGCPLVTATQCVVNGSVPGFRPDNLRCAAYTLAFTERPSELAEALGEAAHKGDVEIVLSVAEILAQKAQSQRDGRKAGPPFRGRNRFLQRVM